MIEIAKLKQRSAMGRIVMQNFWSLFAAYLVFWAIFFIYDFTVARRLARVEKDLLRMKQQMREHPTPR
jgi:Na+/H+ antiporter NhaC